MSHKTIIIVLIGIISSSCLNHENIAKEENQNLNLYYEIYSKKELFPYDSIKAYVGYIILDLPDSLILYTDIAENIKQIGIKENMIAARLFSSIDGYLMEMDSVQMDFSTYYESLLGYYDLTTIGLNWKYTFDIYDIQFKGDLPIKININK